MTTHTIDITGLPDGWTPIAYRRVNIGEHFLKLGHIVEADIDSKCGRLIVVKENNPSIIVPEKTVKSLNQWLHINTAPLGRRVRLYDGYHQLEGRLYEDRDRECFTHWQELPEDPI